MPSPDTREVTQAEARPGYRHFTLTLHCAIHEDHDRHQAAKIVAGLQAATDALNAIGRAAPPTSPQALHRAADLEGIVHLATTAAHHIVHAAISGAVHLPDDILDRPIQLSDYPGHLVLAVSLQPADGMPAMIRADQYAAAPPTTTHHPQAGNA